jgi:hypothetical protein
MTPRERAAKLRISHEMGRTDVRYSDLTRTPPAGEGWLIAISTPTDDLEILIEALQNEVSRINGDTYYGA